MPPLAASSRRALVAAAALTALAPDSGAKRKKKKRKKPQPPPPLAFAVATLVDVNVNDDGARFDVTIPVAFVHPPSGFSSSTEVQGTIDVPATDAELRAAIVAEARSFVVVALQLNGEDVPADRVAIALL